MNPILRFFSRALAGRLPLPTGSLRAQLIFWNVIALSLLVGGLGIVCRFVMLSFMMQSVDQELERGIGMYLRPPPSPPGPFASAKHPPFEGLPEDHKEDHKKNFKENFKEDFKGDFKGGGPPPDHRREEPGEPHPFPLGADHPDRDHPDRSHPDENRPPHHAPDANNPFRIHHYTAAGKSELAEDTRPAWDPDALIRALRGESVFSTVMVDGDPVRVFSSPGFTHRGEKGAVQNAYPLKEVYRAIAGIDTALFALIPVGLLGAGWMGSALTNRVLRRVHRMTQAAGQIGIESRMADFSRRLPVSGNDEFSELAQTFNGLLGRLDGAFQEQKQMLYRQQRFTADASHELKTPLTIIKGRAGLALSRASTDERSRRAFQEIDAASETMARLVQDLLLLARSDEGQMGRDAVELPVGEMLETALAQARQEGGALMTLRIEPENLTIRGNEAELTRLFRNLLDNAVQYTPARGYINITARQAQEKIVVTVEDAGVGIAPEHLPHLGERFYRVDASRTRPTGGTGLGLSICRSVAAAHGGTLTFQSAPGVGTTVTVVLPIQRGIAA